MHQFGCTRARLIGTLARVSGEGIELRRASHKDAAAMAGVWLRSFAAALPQIRRAHSDDDVCAGFADIVVAQLEAWVATSQGVVVGLLVLDHAELKQLYLACR